MVQTQSPTDEGYAEVAKLLAGSAATAAKSMVLVKTTIVVSETQTYAGITKVTETGLALVDSTVTNVTTTTAYDSVKVNHKWTAGATVTVLGFGVCNDDDDVLFMICAFDAAVAMESGDTLDCTGTMQIKKGS